MFKGQILRDELNLKLDVKLNYSSYCNKFLKTLLAIKNNNNNIELVNDYNGHVYEPDWRADWIRAVMVV